MNESFDVRLESLRQVSDSTREFTFLPVDGRRVTCEPGQFYRFVFADEQGEFERSYSLCNLEFDGPAMELVVSEVNGGRATAVLWDAEPGLTARVTGPFGRLLVPDPLPQRLVMVATSVGIAPYMPMLAPLTAAAREGRVTVEMLFGVRDPSEFLFAPVLTRFGQTAGVNLSVCYSRQQPEPLHDGAREGYVTQRLTEIDPDPEQDQVLLCGNPQMIDDCYALLKARGFKARQVRREKYVFAKDGPATGPSVSDADRQLIAAKLAKLKSGD